MLALQFSYTSAEAPLPEQAAVCRIGFGAQAPVLGGAALCIHTDLPLLPGDSARAEQIHFAGAPLERGAHGAVSYLYTPDWLVAQIQVPLEAADDIAAITEQSYRALFSCMHQLGFAQVVRIWNYLPDINNGEGDAEVYKQFCWGRHRAFAALALPPAQFPAASALGRPAGGLLVYALAHAGACSHIENPQQTSAYCYPREYGPASPSFARASLAGDTLFISGTASILNAQSYYPGDVIKQAQLSCQNIQRVMAQAQRQAAATFTLRLAKVYLRCGAERAQLHSLLPQWLGPDCELVWLQADICRAELLIEIEGIAVRD